MLYPKNQSSQLEKSLFENPTSEYRATPFWAWNCKLTKDLLLREIEQMKRMGLGGFHMHSRSGMATDYLSEDFFDLIKACVDKARKENMLAWLYDEDRWPSGAAGGILTKDHAMRSRHLLFTQYPYGAEAPPMDDSHHQMGTRTGNGALIARFHVDLNEDGTIKGYRVETDVLGDTKLPAPVWHVYLEYAMDNPWYNNQAYVDTLNPAAIQKFIQLTHEKYKEKVGGDFGGVVPAIFTDEPQFTKKLRLPFAADVRDIVLPWTNDFAQTYKKAYGMDVMEHLPELIWDLPGGKPSRPRFCYHDHVAERFAAAFSDQVGAWCEANGIALTGHMMAEETLQSQTGMVGDAMRSLRSFQIPGIDMLCDRREYATAKQAQSVAHQYGRPGVMSELYGVTNWDFDFRGHKLQGDWQAALGVTVRVPHLTWVSMEGEAKRDYPASIGYQSPWYEEYPLIEDHFARVNTALTRGKPSVKVGLIHPVESYWLKWGPNQNTAQERKEMDQRYLDVVEWLIFGQIDFNFVSESLLPSQCEKGAAPLKVGEMAYDAVIVPWCENLRASTIERLEAFQKAGGKLIFMGEAPKYVDAAESDRGAALAAISTRIQYDPVPLMRALDFCRDVEISDMRTGERADGLIYQMREDGGGKWLFICQGRLPASHDQPKGRVMMIRVKGAWNVTLYDTMTGEVRPCSPLSQDEYTQFFHPFDLHDSLLVRLESTTKVSSAAAIGFIGGDDHSHLDGKAPRLNPVEIELSEPNALLLDIAQYRIDDGAWNPPEELLRADNAGREQLGWPLRMSQYAQPWVVPAEPVTHTFHARFTIHSQIEVTGAKLALEQAELTGITLNGQKVESKTDGWYVDESIRTVALPAIPKGGSLLELAIPFGPRVGVEWCYLLGDFGVRVSGATATITPPVRTLSFGDITAQGLPFYGGNIRYKFPLSGKARSVFVQATQYRGALLAVDIDGERKGTIVFAPYAQSFEVPAGAKELGITLFGSRINSFGAVHNCNDLETWAGPNAWRSRGQAWSYEYRLRKIGILIDPIIREV